MSITVKATALVTLRQPGRNHHWQSQADDVLAIVVSGVARHCPIEDYRTTIHPSQQVAQITVKFLTTNIHEAERAFTDALREVNRPYDTVKVEAIR